MLKRYQVLLEDWMVDHIKDMAGRYDMSFSEMLRVLLSAHTLELIELTTRYKSKIDWKRHEKFVKAGNLDHMERSEFHKALSKLYFETQKAIENFYILEKKK